MVVANSWEGVSLHAKRVGAKFPELVAAQWALESGFGKHPLVSTIIWLKRALAVLVKQKSFTMVSG
jgi:hypothetical protein